MDRGLRAHTVYTIGTGTRTINEFLDIVKHKGIKVLIDVRRFPTSKFEHFKKVNFEKICNTHGIEYRYLGDRLGGYRRGGYEQYTTTEEFQSGLEELKALVARKVVSLVCAETLPWRCHRRFIGKRLTAQGYDVIHIIDERHDWRPK